MRPPMPSATDRNRLLTDARELVDILDRRSVALGQIDAPATAEVLASIARLRTHLLGLIRETEDQR